MALCMLQAETWVRGKLRDLKDGCNLQDCEEVAQTLQRDMKDFENTLIKLNQVGPGRAWHGMSPVTHSTCLWVLAAEDPWEPLMLSGLLGPTDG